MRPLLQLHSSKDALTQEAIRTALADQFALTADDLEERIPSGTARRFANRVAWASTHMTQAGLLTKPRRGVSLITDRGLAVLAACPDRVDMSVLEQFPEYISFRTRSRTKTSAPAVMAPSSETPEEALVIAFDELRDALLDDLHGRLVAATDRFFEDVVLDVLVGLGYGGSKRDAAERVGRSGDGGIDGVIREDVLGLDAIYVQAKKWSTDRTVGPREIREFIGALQDVDASKGVFITTTSFSSDARELARRRRIVLIDGRELAGLMIDAGIGVSTFRTYALKRVDEDYFGESP